MAREYVAVEDVQFVEANGARLGYLERGQGPLVVLLHGFPDTAESWRETMAALSDAGYRAVAPFLRGYAPSEIPDTDVAVETLSRDALALINALGEEAATVVGHDWGAVTAYGAAYLAPERVKKLVTIGIPHISSIRPSFRVAMGATHFLYLRRRSAEKRMRANDFAHVDALYRRWSPTWDVSAEELQSVKNAFTAPGCLNAAIGYYRAWPFTRGGPKFLKKRISVETLTVAGADDPTLLPKDYHRAEKWFDAPYRVDVFPGGHFVHRESAEAFNQALLDFI